MERHQPVSGSARTCSISCAWYPVVVRRGIRNHARVVEAFTPARPLSAIGITCRHAWLSRIEVGLLRLLALEGGQTVFVLVIR